MQSPGGKNPSSHSKPKFSGVNLNDSYRPASNKHTPSGFSRPMVGYGRVRGSGRQLVPTSKSKASAPEPLNLPSLKSEQPAHHEGSAQGWGSNEKLPAPAIDEEQNETVEPPAPVNDKRTSVGTNSSANPWSKPQSSAADSKGVLQDFPSLNGPKTPTTGAASNRSQTDDKRWNTRDDPGDRTSEIEQRRNAWCREASEAAPIQIDRASARRDKPATPTIPKPTVSASPQITPSAHVKVESNKVPTPTVAKREPSVSTGTGLASGYEWASEQSDDLDYDHLPSWIAETGSVDDEEDPPSHTGSPSMRAPRQEPTSLLKEAHKNAVKANETAPPRPTSAVQEPPNAWRRPAEERSVSNERGRERDIERDGDRYPNREHDHNDSGRDNHRHSDYDRWQRRPISPPRARHNDQGRWNGDDRGYGRTGDRDYERRDDYSRNSENWNRRPSDDRGHRYADREREEGWHRRPPEILSRNPRSHGDGENDRRNLRDGMEDLQRKQQTRDDTRKREEESRRKQEEEKLRLGAQRKLEEEKRIKEEEEKRKSLEEQKRREEERKRLEEQRLRREEEERLRLEELERKRLEEQRQRIEEERKKAEEEKRRLEEERRQHQERMRLEEERRLREEEKRQMEREEEMRMLEEEEKLRLEEEAAISQSEHMRKYADAKRWTRSYNESEDKQAFVAPEGMKHERNPASGFVRTLPYTSASRTNNRPADSRRYSTSSMPKSAPVSTKIPPPALPLQPYAAVVVGSAPKSPTTSDGAVTLISSAVDIPITPTSPVVAPILCSTTPDATTATPSQSNNATDNTPASSTENIQTPSASTDATLSGVLAEQQSAPTKAIPRERRRKQRRPEPGSIDRRGVPFVGKSNPSDTIMPYPNRLTRNSAPPGSVRSVNPAPHTSFRGHPLQRSPMSPAPMAQPIARSPSRPGFMGRPKGRSANLTPQSPGNPAGPSVSRVPMPSPSRRTMVYRQKVTQVSRPTAPISAVTTAMATEPTVLSVATPITTNRE